MFFNSWTTGFASRTGNQEISRIFDCIQLAAATFYFLDRLLLWQKSHSSCVPPRLPWLPPLPPPHLAELVHFEAKPEYADSKWSKIVQSDRHVYLFVEVHLWKSFNMTHDESNSHLAPVAALLAQSSPGNSLAASKTRVHKGYKRRS